MKNTAYPGIIFLLIVITMISCLAPESERVEKLEKSRTAAEGAHPTLTWILACRVGQGGFGCFPGDSAFVSRTGMAVDALAELGRLENLPQRESLIGWLKGMQQPDGGFLEAADFYKNKYLPWGTISALEPTYWAVRTLKLLGAEPLSSRSSTQASARGEKIPAFQLRAGGRRRFRAGTWRQLEQFRPLLPDAGHLHGPAHT